ncbi:MAG TPA: NADH-quinone oxidoreductase subunit NuoG, partial [Alphaproteobacteria bacterium]|nr:NADH-quinone oxidoreductase subunit NuoG [Alphaproteobacteria bacterium]
GYDRSRYHENKRAVRDKYMGPLIKTIMTRCINCTRCVRFGEEIAGVTELGQLNRGEDAEIGTFIEKAVSTELSGNMIDICPVGALTSKPYAFKARSWELKKTETIDVHDALGCNIRVDSRGAEVMRVLPRLHEDVNEEWINDRSRFAYDGLKKNRLDQPYIRDEKTKKLQPATWEQALTLAGSKLKTFKKDNIAAYAGDLADAESMFALKSLMGKLGVGQLECRVDGGKFDPLSAAGYSFNTTITGIEDADAILLVGTNPRHEGTMVNARIRKTWLDKRVKVGMVGEQVDLTYPYDYLGASPKDLEKLMKAKGGFADVLRQAERPMVIVGAGALAREDGDAVQALVRKVAEEFGMISDNWNGYNVLHNAASRMAALEMGFVPAHHFDLADMGLVYLLGVDNPETVDAINPHSFVIYQGHHGDIGAHRADIILPGAAYTEKDGIYMNTEGRAQRGRRAVFPPGEAREDWAILRALSDRCDKPLDFVDHAELRAQMIKAFPRLGAFDDIQPVAWGSFGGAGHKVSAEPFVNPIKNFYITNVITKSSDTMQRCTAEFVNHETFQEAAE